MKAIVNQNLVRKLPRQNIEIRDTRLVGFIVRCRASGVHSFRVDCGRFGRLTLGRVGTLEPHEAREQARLMLADVAKGVDPLAGKRRSEQLTWATFLTKHYGPWLAVNLKHGADTLASLRSRFAAFDDVYLKDLTAFAVEKWRTARLKAGAKPATVNRNLADLRGALSRARQWNLLHGVHPLEHVKASRVDNHQRVRYLSADEETRLRKALTARDDQRREARERTNAWRRERGYEEWPALGVYTDHVQPLVLLALGTGCRRGELLGLQWRDVDVIHAQLHVRAEDAKSGRSRVVSLHSEMVMLLKTWRPATVDANAFVFPGPNGERMASVKSGWQSLMKTAKISAFRFHDLRHTFASKLAMHGTDLNTIRELLGHKDLTMTIRYAHLSPDHKAAAVAKLVTTA